MKIGKAEYKFSFVKSGKFNGCKEEEEHLVLANGVKPRFGYNYWFWIPQVEFKSPKKYVTIFKFIWLNFIIDIDRWES